MFLFFLSFLFADPPKFSGANSYARLETLIEQGNRFYGAPQRKKQIQNMEDSLTRYGWKTTTQSFSVVETVSKKKYTLTNIIALDPKKSKKRFLLGTHWDTRLWAEEDSNPSSRNKPIVGANDGSSGVALLLELAATLQENPLQNIAVDIIFFDGEEFGRPRNGDYCKGSEYFINHRNEVYPYTPNGAVILDMIADADLKLERETHSIRHSPNLWKQVQQHLFNQEIEFADRSRAIRDDQHPFIEKKIPSILLIDLSYPYWHTHEDTLDKCSAESMQKIGNALISWLFALDGTHKE